jgi:class 3 adenylate cyclase
LHASTIFPFGRTRPGLQIRIGLHNGPVVGGIVGTTMPR